MSTGYTNTTNARFEPGNSQGLLTNVGRIIISQSLGSLMEIHDLDDAIALRRKLDAAILDMKAAVEYREAQERKRKWGTND